MLSKPQTLKCLQGEVVCLRGVCAWLIAVGFLNVSIPAIQLD